MKRSNTFLGVLIVAVILVSTYACFSSTSASPNSGATTAQSANTQYFAGSFVGSKNSNVYHYPSCSEAKKIKPENLVNFNSVEDACAQGYRPCKVCNPPPCPTTTPVPTATPQPTVTPAPKPTATPAPTVSQAEASLTPTASPTQASPSASSVPQASATETAVTASAAAKGSTPGFEAVFAIAGILAVGYVLKQRRG